MSIRISQSQAVLKAPGGTEFASARSGFPSGGLDFNDGSISFRDESGDEKLDF
jgi:hypothetical protein